VAEEIGSTALACCMTNEDDHVGIVRPFDGDRRDTGLFRRLFLAAWEQRIADVNHLFV
jgi:hypothetical protein